MVQKYDISTNEETLSFVLTDKTKVLFELDRPITEIHCCHEASIILLHDSQRVLIGGDSVRVNLSTFSALLSEALKNKLQLHPSITKDIGYLYNEYSYYLYNKDSYDKNFLKNIPTYIQSGNVKSWVGEKNNLWSARLTSGLYNDTNGKIIFELTPVYPGKFATVTEEPYHAWYKEWLERYQPYLILEVPKKIARQWLEEANHALLLIEESVKKEFNLPFNQRKNN
jgi:hypothetical protein